MFEPTEEYEIMGNIDLTPELSVEKPYVMFGEMEVMENITGIKPGKNLLSISWY